MFCKVRLREQSRQSWWLQGNSISTVASRQTPHSVPAMEPLVLPSLKLPLPPVPHDSESLASWSFSNDSDLIIASGVSGMPSTMAGELFSAPSLRRPKAASWESPPSLCTRMSDRLVDGTMCSLLL